MNQYKSDLLLIHQLKQLLSTFQLYSQLKGFPSFRGPLMLSEFSTFATLHSDSDFVESHMQRQKSLACVRRAPYTGYIPKLHEAIARNLSKLSEAFEGVFHEYEGTRLIKSHGESKFIHVLVIHQYFLDSYATIRGFYQELVDPLGDRNWVNFVQFLQCIDNIHKTTFKAFFRLRNYEALMSVQKLLFCFCVVVGRNKRLDKDRICEVFIMANMKANAGVSRNINLLISELMRNLRSYTIEEFKRSITIDRNS